MPPIIAIFEDGSRLEYGQGAFDEWCVYLTRPHVARYAPKDTEYFAAMRELARKHGGGRVYRDFLAIYEITGRTVDVEALRLIDGLSKGYGGDGLTFGLIFTTIYAGMIAEENKVGTRLGRRVKRLGVYQILMLDMPVEIAANYSRGKPWKEIARECERYGF